MITAAGSHSCCFEGFFLIHLRSLVLPRAGAANKKTKQKTVANFAASNKWVLRVLEKKEQKDTRKVLQSFKDLIFARSGKST